MTRPTPDQLAAWIVDSGALIGDEAKGVRQVARRIIREERRGTVRLTRAEARAALEAIAQMTDGNARDFEEWKKQTCGTRRQWNALLAAEAKIAALTGDGA